jgi:hypothetical protein
MDSPMLIVACLLITSGERGLSVVTSKVFRSCSGEVELLLQPSTAEACAHAEPVEGDITCSLRPLDFDIVAAVRYARWLILLERVVDTACDEVVAPAQGPFHQQIGADPNSQLIQQDSSLHQGMQLESMKTARGVLLGYQWQALNPLVQFQAVLTCHRSRSAKSSQRSPVGAREIGFVCYVSTVNVTRHVW